MEFFEIGYPTLLDIKYSVHIAEVRFSIVYCLQYSITTTESFTNIKGSKLLCSSEHHSIRNFLFLHILLHSVFYIGYSTKLNNNRNPSNFCLEIARIKSRKYLGQSGPFWKGCTSVVVFTCW